MYFNHTQRDLKIVTRYPKIKLSAQKEIYVPQEDKRAGNNKDRRYSTREKSKGTREEEGIFSTEGQRTAPWIKRRQTWPIGKWQFLKGKEETMC